MTHPVAPDVHRSPSFPAATSPDDPPSTGRHGARKSLVPTAGRRWMWGVVILALVVLVVGAATSVVSGRAESAAEATPPLATVPLETEPSLSPLARSGALGDPSSIRAASAWVEALVAGDSELARLMLCTGGLEAFPDGPALAAEFGRVVGGALLRHIVVEVQREDDRDLVVFSGLTDGAVLVSFVVSVIVLEEGRSLCGFWAA